MEKKKQYNGLDAVKFILALLVAQRHIIQIFFDGNSRWRILVGNWLSNLAVPVFFIIAGFFLFRKMDERSSDPKIVYRYCVRILKLYLIWSVLYLPVDIRNWYYGTRNVKEGILSYLQSFFFCSSIPQLWYLPALCVACLLVWFGWSKGMKLWQLLTIGFCLLLAGYLSDNWYYNQRFPDALSQLTACYRRYFITPRNGIFYGSFYVAAGLAFARISGCLSRRGASSGTEGTDSNSRKRRLFCCCAFAGFCFFLWCMYREVMRCTDAGSNTNFVLSAAPAAVCLFAAAASVDWKDRPMYRRLRGMSEWIYLSHFYFFQFLAWLRPWNPVPFTSRNVTVMIMVPMLVICWGLVRLSETGRGGWLKKLI